MAQGPILSAPPPAQAQLYGCPSSQQAAQPLPSLQSSSFAHVLVRKTVGDKEGRREEQEEEEEGEEEEKEGKEEEKEGEEEEEGEEKEEEQPEQQ
ncbi:hypothetical protein DUI87_30179 [Hirundo rustica rustica]|uniref:Uncharacterized protein n=1 Tax=Hirundo rustica rustica TaxID=333673 RepID=A0A3M0IY73_HIRRU|nr:hypothetical protein DUI87_30179 [Hirundo rustica rustica]